jgi:hypothetical protein
MKKLFFCALFSTTLLCATPTRETELILACKQRDTLKITQLLLEDVPVTRESLMCAFENGDLDVATILCFYNKNLYIPKSWFRKYCQPGRTRVASWLLVHGSGPYYEQS